MLEALITHLNDREHAQATRHTECQSAAVHQVCYGRRSDSEGQRHGVGSRGRAEASGRTGEAIGAAGARRRGDARGVGEVARRSQAGCRVVAGLVVALISRV